MTSHSILSWLAPRGQFAVALAALRTPNAAPPPVNLHELAQTPAAWPRFVRESALARRYLDLLGPLAWDRFPERDLQPDWGRPIIPYAAFAAACLVQLDLQLTHMSQLHQLLLEHPALMWVLRFPLVPTRHAPEGFDVAASLPTHRHLTRMLRTCPNTALQFLLDDTVRLLRAELASEVDDFGQCVSLDTKHILAWVQENNPKAYLKNSERYDKTRQPAGDPDCRLGCKRRHNQVVAAPEPPTPTSNPVPAHTISIGEYYWGYASGVVATKVPAWGEFVLAELTQPFDRPDVAYFFPLLAAVERRLGFRPRYGALDAAFDAFYVYEYFYRENEDGFAAVPFVQRGGHTKTFAANGLPLCAAGQPMPLKYTFINRSGLVEHECGRYACPLRFPDETGQPCPVNHPQAAKGGCTTTIATSIGARLRYQLDRESDAYKKVYNQRTATERINSQAVELGIERPKLRNGPAIANRNTLIYVLINLRALQRIRQEKARRHRQAHSGTPAV
jgi:hypothetical protein